MLISAQSACRLLTEFTEDCAVPAAPGNLSRYAFQSSDYVVIGDVAVRGYKHKNRWRVDDRDIRRAAAQLAALDVDLLDLVDARLSSDASRQTWRGRISDWISHGAYRDQSDNGCPCGGEEPCRRDKANGHGLPCGLTWERFTERYGERSIAFTRPLPMLTWSGSAWLVPRAYAALLDRADEITAQLSGQAAVCSSCGARGDVWQWRSSSAAGFTTLCPSCTAATARLYTGHFRGTAYKALPKNSRADAFLCRLCSGPRRALYWDHCHEHGLVRGPVCASCNTFEGGGGRFLRRPGAVGHLLECTGCRNTRTLPPRHHADVVRERYGFPSHDSCGHDPSGAWGSTLEDGSVRFRLFCYQHEQTLRWEQTVPAEQVRSLVRDFVDQALQDGTA
ncbi:endonuclease domain-containing protein [Streptomyces sp. NPDC058548]|uniref:endonuclease domain-containing protein n=1 Tax=Streptomyces sp. NPDC058548 TaxID=3346545 RepID=UPI0036516DD3